MNVELLDIINDRIYRGQGIKVHLGSAGNVRKDYFNVDTNLPGVFKIDTNTYTIGMDAFEFLGHIPYESCDAIRSTFFLEHLDPAQILEIMGIFINVLKIGGTMIHETDDFLDLFSKLEKLDDEVVSTGKIDFMNYTNLCSYIFSKKFFGKNIACHCSLWTERIAECWFESYPEFRVESITKSGWGSLIIVVKKIIGLTGASIF
jgi:predicted SAM-dependent methyltransferase